MSIKIKNPSSRLGSSRAAYYQRIDEETGVDHASGSLRLIEGDHVKSFKMLLFS